MRLASLGSGSKGNATLIECGEHRLLLDCGFALAETEVRLRRLDVDPCSLSAVLVTHEHHDHMGGVGPLARRYKLPVYMSRGSRLSGRCGTIAGLHELHAEEPVSFGRIRVFPFSVPHDAREPLQFAFEMDGLRLVVLTDVGSVTPHVVQQLDGCDVLMLECNHDEMLLRNGRYPPGLKQRVGGEFGHLSNAQSAQFLSKMSRARLHSLIAAHLSEENNRPELAQAALADVMQWTPEQIRVATQQEGFHWLAFE